MSSRISPLSEPRIGTAWLPVLVGMLLCSLVAVFSWQMFANQRNVRQEALQTVADRFADDMAVDMKSRVAALQRIATRWEYRGGTPKGEFLNDARSYRYDLPGFQAIEWVDKNFIIRWIEPMAGNEQALNLDLGFERNRRIALEEAKTGRVPVLSKPIDLVQGGKGILIYFPIFLRGDFDGFVLAVLRTQDWLSYVLRFNEKHDELKEVRFRIKGEGVPLFQQDGWDELGETSMDASVRVQIMGRPFVINVRPSDQFLVEHSSVLPQAATAVGLILSVLVSFVVHFFQRATVEAWVSNTTKAALEQEIEERVDAEDQLQMASNRLQLATKAGRIGVWTWDIETNELNWDDRMFDLYDIPPDVVPRYETWRTSVHPEDLSYAEGLLQLAVEGKAKFETEFRVLHQGGEVRYIQAAARVNRDADGKPTSVVGVNWDITERKKGEEALKTERRRLADIIRGTNVGTWEWNIQTGETIFNERWANILGYTLDEISPVSIETWMKFCHQDDLKKSGELLEKHFSGELEYYEFVARMRHRNGDWIWVLDRGKVASWTEDGKPLLMSGTHMDITAQKQSEEQIRHLATHDTLTDLPTLRLAKDRIRMALATSHRKKLSVAVMFVDLDGFKLVNDTLGHDAGDALLIDTARRLEECVRSMDTVARIGGDEFLVILSEVGGRDDVERVASKVVAAIATPYEYDDQQMTVGASVGIALRSDECAGPDIDDFVRKADEAMYTVKKSGKNGYAFAEEEMVCTGEGLLED